MGQYFILINKTKKQYLHPHKVNDGLKAIELLDSNSSKLFFYLFISSTDNSWACIDTKYLGSWAGDDVLILGDYDETYKNLYEEIIKNKDYIEISNEILKELEKVISNYDYTLKGFGFKL